MSCKKVILNEFGGPEVLQVVEEATLPESGAGEVRVKVLAASAGRAVGTALLELGRLLDLEMYGAASKSKHELVRSLGGSPIDIHLWYTYNITYTCSRRFMLCHKSPSI